MVKEGFLFFILFGSLFSLRAETLKLNQNISITNENSSIVIRDAEKVIWEADLNSRFLTYEIGKNVFKENYGAFKLRRKRASTRCYTRNITGLRSRNGEAILAGEFRARRGRLCPQGFEIRFQNLSNKRVGFEVHLVEPKVASDDPRQRVELTYKTNEEERFYGFGMQFTYLDLKGQKVKIISQEQGTGRGIWPLIWFQKLFTPLLHGSPLTTYAAAPHYITSELRSLYLKNYEYSEFDLRKKNQVKVSLFGGQMVGEIFSGDSPLDLIQTYTSQVGRMKSIPDWFHKGAILGLMGGSERVREVLKKLEDNDAAISSFWMQDWVGQRDTFLGTRLLWNWQLHTPLYPDWYQLTLDLGAKGYGTLGYINPFLSQIPPDQRKGVRYLYKEAEVNGYLIKDKKGKIYETSMGGFKGVLVDLWNPEAREWLKDIIKEKITRYNMKGWMADFGEALPFDIIVGDGIASHKVHNKYPEEWALVNKEAIEELGRDDIVYFSRSGFTNSPGKAKMFWLGDQMTTWDNRDGIKTALYGLLSGGFSGFSLNHSDIGGYVSFKIPIIGNFLATKELYLRWIEMNAFTAAFRTHEGLKPKDNWQVDRDEETLKFFSKFSRVFASLKDYRKELFKEAEEKGYPVARHMLLHYFDDPITHDLKNQFMLGSDVLVAPVLDKGKKKVKVYLPKGEWVHPFTGKAFNHQESKWIEVSAPLGTPAVFIKNSRIDLVTKLKTAFKD